MRCAACILYLGLVGCGGNLALPAGAEGQDAMTSDSMAASDAGTGVDSEAACLPFAGGGEPALVRAALVDGAVPESEAAVAQAVALCDYLDRCTPMAVYERNECITSFSQRKSWNFVACTHDPSDLRYGCGASYGMAQLGMPFEVTDDAGIYDGRAMAACLQALEAQPCHGPGLWWNVPACTGQGAMQPCASDADCTADAAARSCVAGYCVSSSCGDFDFPSIGCSFVGEGQPCDDDPPALGRNDTGLPRRCTPGLTCAGLPGDGGSGTCTQPSDVGGPCSEEAQITGCAAGLLCQCGQCAIPPSQGPCIQGLCEIGVAYCDTTSNTCDPVKAQGAACSQPIECAPHLECYPLTSTCQPAGQ
jgi:hypothetical protein